MSGTRGPNTPGTLVGGTDITDQRLGTKTSDFIVDKVPNTSQSNANNSMATPGSRGFAYGAINTNVTQKSSNQPALTKEQEILS